MKMEETERSETLEYKIQTPGHYPEERIQHSEHGKSLKPRRNFLFSVEGEVLSCNTLFYAR